MFKFFKEKLFKIYSEITSKFHNVFQQKSVDAVTIQSVKEILLKADVGIPTTNRIIEQLQQAHTQGKLQAGNDLQIMLQQILIDALGNMTSFDPLKPTVFLMVGINGSGKTTFVGKLAHFLHTHHKKCLIAAADTFRAAASQQLQVWSDQAHAQILISKSNQEPASVVFDACQEFKKSNFDALIIDTAGRLQTKENLMKELEKIKRIITQQLPNHNICTLLTIDAILGQNSLQQAQIFHQATQVDGIVLTKLDASSKGGIVFAINQDLAIPVRFLSWGEQLQDMMIFDTNLYVKNLLGLTQFQSTKNS